MSIAGIFTLVCYSHRLIILDDQRPKQDGFGGPKGPGSAHDYLQLIHVRAMSMNNGSSFFNYMRIEPLKIGPRIQKSDTNFRRAFEPGLELARTPRA